MQNNYYFLRQLSRQLEPLIIDLEFVACFSQEKDELIIGFFSRERTLYIKAVLSSEICCLTFPDNFYRKGRNSVDLFNVLLGSKVTAVHQFSNERCFSLGFSNGYTLLFKMHGQWSNLVLFDEAGNVAQMFKNQMEKDENLDLATLDRHPDQTFEGFLKNGLRKTFPTFDKYILDQLDLEGKSPDLQWAEIQKTVNYLENPLFYTVLLEGEPKLLLFEKEKVLHKTIDPVEALNHFYHSFSRKYYFEREQFRILKLLEKNKGRTENYIQKTEEKLLELEENIRNEQIANIIMANLHAIPERATSAVLFDFYNEKDVTVKFKENTTPQKTAEVYYRKAKNQKIEVDKLYANLELKQQQLADFLRHIEHISQITDLRSLRRYMKDEKLSAEEETAPESPFKKFQYEGFEILVGKNAKNNDLLTQRYAFKEDLWLHARDVSGSHVIIKYQAGKKFPSTVIEKAAQLAAYYSKRKNDTLCPVIYTPKKYVRKPKGSAEGAVVIDKEQVIMVRPEQFNE